MNSKDYIPQRPDGSDAEARFAQSVHDSIYSSGRLGHAPGMKISRTTKGIFISGGRGGKASLPDTVEVVLCDSVTGEQKIYVLYGYEKTVSS